LSAPNDNHEFQQAAAAGRTGLIGEFWGFLKHNKKWWLLPILVVLLAVGILAVLVATPAAPFIYTLF
jgi:hypothetical protein